MWDSESSRDGFTDKCSSTDSYASEDKEMPHSDDDCSVTNNEFEFESEQIQL
jgi:hypothetical protein